MIRLASAHKYELMAADLRKRILSGKFSPGTKLKTDMELAEEYGINKRTVASGMAVLVAEGLISRTPGRGTVVERTRIVERSGSVIGVLSESTGDLYEDMEKEITEQTLKKGFYPLWVPQSLFNQVIMTPGHPLFRQFLEYMINDKPYGLIVHGERFIPFDLFERNRAKIGRLVFINQYLHTRKMQAKYVLIDYKLAARQILQHYAEHGHRSIALWATFMHNPVTEKSRPPQQILLDAMNEYSEEFGVAVDNEIPALLMKGADPEAVLKEKLLTRKITGVVLGVDSAFLQLAPICEKHLGEDWRQKLSLIGLYNTAYAETHQFSSIDVQGRQIARQATEMLFDESDDIREVLIPTKLVDRGSVHSAG